ncbi:MAG: hypothetical protein J7K54_04815 [Candidatus Aenigmarchaeota archaeon]|nr:hypothetical protein [Candidatus Aenigmarchaeota archaeon]
MNEIEQFLISRWTHSHWKVYLCLYGAGCVLTTSEIIERLSMGKSRVYTILRELANLDIIKTSGKIVNGKARVGYVCNPKFNMPPFFEAYSKK